MKTRLNYFSGAYRYGMNGQERDDEVSGAGNSYTAQFWQYDPRIGRRWNIDPVTYPWQSSYSCFNSNPILYQDPNGLYGTKREAKRQKASADKQGYVTGEIKSNKTGNLIFNRYDYSFQGYDPNQSEATVTDYSTNDFRTSAEREFDWQMEQAADNILRAMKDNSYQNSLWGKLSGFEHSFNSMKGSTYRSDWEGYSDMDNSGDVSPTQGAIIAAITVGTILTGGTLLLYEGTVATTASATFSSPLMTGTALTGSTGTGAIIINTLYPFGETAALTTTVSTSATVTESVVFGAEWYMNPHYWALIHNWSKVSTTTKVVIGGTLGVGVFQSIWEGQNAGKGYKNNSGEIPNPIPNIDIKR